MSILFFGEAQVVVPGHVIRSRQLMAPALEKAIGDFGIRSVLNLRGHGHGGTWYPEEIEVCRQADVAHATVTFNVDEWPPRPTAVRFLKTIEDLDPPVLMHCRRGVDRTGWAAGVVVLANGGSLDDGEAQLAPPFGHLCFRSKCPQHKFFASYRRWLKENSQNQSEVIFRRWLANVYCPDPWNARLSIAGDAPGAAVAGSEISLSVEATNQGDEPWQIEESGIRLGLRVIGPIESIPESPEKLFVDRQTTSRDLGRSGTPGSTVEAGESKTFTVTAKLPAKPGLYLVQVDMVKEHVHWFSEMGWPGIVWSMEIVEREGRGEMR